MFWIIMAIGTFTVVATVGIGVGLGIALRKTDSSKQSRLVHNLSHTGLFFFFSSFPGFLARGRVSPFFFFLFFPISLRRGIAMEWQ